MIVICKQPSPHGVGCLTFLGLQAATVGKWNIHSAHISKEIWIDKHDIESPLIGLLVSEEPLQTQVINKGMAEFIETNSS